MDGDKGNESDGDFASAESEQGEQLTVTDTSCSAGDVIVTSQSVDNVPSGDKPSDQQDKLHEQQDGEGPSQSKETADLHDSHDDNGTQLQVTSEVSTTPTAQDNVNPQAQVTSIEANTIETKDSTADLTEAKDSTTGVKDSTAEVNDNATEVKNNSTAVKDNSSKVDSTKSTTHTTQKATGQLVDSSMDATSGGDAPPKVWI